MGLAILRPAQSPPAGFSTAEFILLTNDLPHINLFSGAFEDTEGGARLWIVVVVSILVAISGPIEAKIAGNGCRYIDAAIVSGSG